jgi:hypothetical protein
MDSIILLNRTSLLLQIRSALKIGSQLGFFIPVRCFKIIPVRVRNHFTIILPKTGTAGLEKRTNGFN